MKESLAVHLNVSLVSAVLGAHAKGHAQNLPGLGHAQLPHLKLGCKNPDLQGTGSLRPWQELLACCLDWTRCL